MHQAAALAGVAETAHELGLGVVVFTGYELEHLRRLPSPGVRALLAATDLLVDGPYLEARRSTRRRWVGSDNQRVHHLTERYRHHPELRDRHVQSVHVCLTGDELVVSGWPTVVEEISHSKSSLAPQPATEDRQQKGAIPCR